MTDLRDVTSLFPDLDVTELTQWIERRWVRPDPAGNGDWVFQEVDIARVRLIHDLRHDCEVPPEAMPVLLSLLDQLYATRSRLQSVLHALERQPDAVRRAVLAALEVDRT